MKNLNKLAIKYKKTNNKNTLTEIFNILQPIINKKVNSIYFKLRYYKIEKLDIQQELYIKIIQIIKNYDTEKPFENYLNSSLKNWKPKLSAEDKIRYESLYKKDKETQTETEIKIEDDNQEEIDSNLKIEDILNQCQTKNERKICELYLENPNITERELAKKCGTYQRAISRILNRLRKRLKKFV